MFETFFSNYIDACDELAITPLSRQEVLALLHALQEEFNHASKASLIAVLH